MASVKKFITADKTIRASVVFCTDVVKEIVARQQSLPIASIALGRVTAGSILLAAQLKQKQRIGLNFKGDGPLNGLFSEATFEGRVRSWCGQPQVPPAENQPKDCVGAVMGAGILTVLQSQDHNKHEPHSGIVEFESGEISDDIALYLRQSHQIPSVVSLGTRIDEDGQVLISGGILIEVMPGCSEQSLINLEETALKVSSFSELAAEGKSEYEMAECYLPDQGLVSVTHNEKIEFHCPCSKSRVLNAIKLLGPKSLEEMLADGKDIETRCEFCSELWKVSLTELAKIKAELDIEKIH